MRRGGVGWALAALIAVAVLAASPPAAAAPGMLVRANAADALDGTLLLTRCVRGACGLYSYADGALTQLPIPSFEFPDDAQQADLGVGPGGGLVASYSRCTSVHRCDLYVYDFATQQETRLPVSHDRAPLTTPTVSGDRVAFTRDPLGRDVPSKRFGLYWARLDSARMHRVAAMPLNVGNYLPRLDLAGTRLAYSGYSALSSCFDQSQVRVTTLFAKHGYGRKVAQGSDRTEVFSVHWDGPTLYWGRDRFVKSSYRHDFTPGQIAKSRIERHRAGAARNEVTGWGRAAIRQVLPDGPSLLYQAINRDHARSGVYDAGDPGFQPVAPPR